MNYLKFVINACLLGVGLAMDAFSVSLANGLNDTGMNRRRMCLIAGTFAGFQFLMPMIGWVCVHTIVEHFRAFESFIPWIALILLSYIGGKMLWEGLHPSEEEESSSVLNAGELIIQGIATSIDALSVGFTIAEYSAHEAFIASLLIAIVTFVICIGGLIIGKKAGTRLAGKASILGGVILIAIGLEIFLGI
ncbi:MAG: manganese efflux pump [Solobacterium sp.]|nr:manganese efflux pump [Solobacterium sp.]